MRKLWSMICVLALLLCACGKVSDAERIIPPSELYTEKEIRSAMNVVTGYFFREYDGCTLTEIRYDEEVSAKAGADWAKQYDADQAIVLLSSFEVDDSGGDGSLEPGGSYKNWQWLLVRDSWGKWKLKTWGYG